MASQTNKNKRGIPAGLRNAIIDLIYKFAPKATTCDECASENGCCYEELTFADAQALVTNSTVVEGKKYYITDKAVTLTGVQGDKFSISGTHSRGFASQGKVTLTGGGAGSVDSIEVNGVELLSGAVAFNVTLAATATDVANNINAFTTGYTAIAAGEQIIIIGITTDSTENGFTVVSTATTITTSDTNMANGADASGYEFDVKFDFANGAIVEMSDIKTNVVKCPYAYQVAFGHSTIDDFPWNHPVAVNNTIDSGRLRNYGFDASAQLIGNYVGTFHDVVLNGHTGGFNSNEIRGIGGGTPYTFRSTGSAYYNVLRGAGTSTYTSTANFTGNQILDTSFFTVSGGATVGGTHLMGFSSINATDTSVANGLEIWNGSTVTLTNGAKVSNSKFSASNIISSVLLGSNPSNDIYAVWSDVTLADAAVANRLIIQGSAGKSTLDASGTTSFNGAMIRGETTVISTAGDYKNRVFDNSGYIETSDAVYVVTLSDKYISYQRTNTGIGTITLPDITSALHGQEIVIKDADYNASVNNITINADASDTVNGAASLVVNIDGTSISIKANATTNDWEVF